MSDESKAIVARLVQEVFNQGNSAVIDQLVDDSFVDHNPIPGTPANKAGLKQQLDILRAAFPGFSVRIEDQVAEGEKVATRITATGTHRGDFLGVPATGKQCSVGAIRIDRVVGGKLVENWEEFDALGMMQQLGAMPS